MILIYLLQNTEINPELQNKTAFNLIKEKTFQQNKLSSTTAFTRQQARKPSTPVKPFSTSTILYTRLQSSSDGNLETLKQDKMAS
jgi:hypothetical protein